MTQLYPRITSDPEICGGDPCIAGTRIPVHVIFSHLAAGDSPDTLLEHFPGLTRVDVAACLDYAASVFTAKALAG